MIEFSSSESSMAVPMRNREKSLKDFNRCFLLKSSFAPVAGAQMGRIRSRDVESRDMLVKSRECE